MSLAHLVALLPPEIQGYRPAGGDGHYRRDTLYRLLDGEAEVYCSLNVHGVVSRTYTQAGAPDVLVDVFDMGSSQDAYGAYHHDMREGPSAGVGKESELAGCSVFFWKHRYFVSAIALANVPEGRGAAVGIAHAIAAEMPETGEIPELVGWLPPSGLVASQVHYFHTWPLLAHYYPFGNDDLLLLSQNTEGVLAPYRDADEHGAELARSALLWVRYPSERTAQTAERHFRSGFLGDSEAGVTQRGDGRWAGSMRQQSLLLVVVGAGSRSGADRLVHAATLQLGGRA